jgi:hypothetical protein
MNEKNKFKYWDLGEIQLFTKFNAQPLDKVVHFMNKVRIKYRNCTAKNN